MMGYEFAPFWRRLGAGFVDWVTALGVGVSVSVGAAAVFALALSGEYSFGTNFGAFLIYFGLPAAFAIVILWQVVTAFRVSSKGDTIGHRLFGLRILKTDGERISRGRALARHYFGSPLLLGYVTPMFVLMPAATILPQLGGSTHPADITGEFIGEVVRFWILWGLAVALVLMVANHAMMHFDAKGQGWHDILTGTVVVREVRQDNQ